MRIMRLLILLICAGCASTPTECVSIRDDWSQIEVSDLPAEVNLGKVLSDDWMLNRDESEILWYRNSKNWYFACLPGRLDDGCWEETYRIMKVNNEWQAVSFDGVICTGAATYPTIEDNHLRSLDLIHEIDPKTDH